MEVETAPRPLDSKRYAHVNSSGVPEQPSVGPEDVIRQNTVRDILSSPSVSDRTSVLLNGDPVVRYIDVRRIIHRQEYISKLYQECLLMCR